MSLNGFAAPNEKSTSEILSFQEWKGAQVLEAKNQVVRLSNRITLLKKGILKVEDSAEVAIDKQDPELSSGRVKTLEDKDLVGRLETQLKSALENLQFTTELGLKDYFAVYLSRYKDQPEAISAAASKLSKEEVLELLKVMLNIEPESEGAEANNASQLKGALVKSLSAKSL